MINQEEIDAVWDAHGVVRFPGIDMSNECRLAAAIMSLQGTLKRAQEASNRNAKILAWITEHVMGAHVRLAPGHVIVLRGTALVERAIEEVGA